MRNLLVRAWFLIGQNLAMRILLGLTYIDNCIRGIFLMEHEIVPEHWGPAAVLKIGTQANLTTILFCNMPREEQIEHTTIWVPEAISIPAETKSPVVLVTLKCGLMTIGRIQTEKLEQSILLQKVDMRSEQTSHFKYWWQLSRRSPLYPISTSELLWLQVHCGVSWELNESTD